MPDSLNLVWGHSVHFTKFPERCSLNSFHQKSAKLHTKYHNQGLIWAITFWAICKKNAKMMALCHFS